MPILTQAQTDRQRLLEDVQTATRSDEPEVQIAHATFDTEKPPGPHQRAGPLATENWLPAVGWLIAAMSFIGLSSLAIYILVASYLVVEPNRIKFLVVGDWGREGSQNQTDVAATMAVVASSFQPDFIISTGDNFYDSGLTSVDDEQFASSFTNVYSSDSLQVQWHAILGNHDYGETYPWNQSSGPPPGCSPSDSSCYYSPLHQLDARLVKRDWRWHCERFFSLPLPGKSRQTLAPPYAELFFIDTNPALPEYHAAAWADRPGGIAEQSWPSQVRELEYRLSTSSARWKIVLGHHPVRNNRTPPIPSLMQVALLDVATGVSSVAMRKDWTLFMHMLQADPDAKDLEPLLRKYGVRAYFSGHEHCLEHLHADSDPTHYFVSGGGSLTDYPKMLTDYGGSQWQHQGSGFATVELHSDLLMVHFYGIESGQPDPIYITEVSLTNV